MRRTQQLSAGSSSSTSSTSSVSSGSSGFLSATGTARETGSQVGSVLSRAARGAASGVTSSAGTTRWFSSVSEAGSLRSLVTRSVDLDSFASAEDGEQGELGEAECDLGGDFACDSFGDLISEEASSARDRAETDRECELDQGGSEGEWERVGAADIESARFAGGGGMPVPGHAGDGRRTPSARLAPAWGISVEQGEDAAPPRADGTRADAAHASSSESDTVDSVSDPDSSGGSDADEQLAYPAGGAPGSDARGYVRIEGGGSAGELKLGFVQRVTLRRDRKYLVLFSLVSVLTLAAALFNHQPGWQHHYLWAMLVAMLISSSATLVLVGSHYRVAREGRHASPFSQERLKLVAPLELAALGLVSLLVGSLASGWAVLLSALPLVVVSYDCARLIGAPEGLQFAAVVLDMAAELAVGGGGSGGSGSSSSSELRSFAPRALAIFSLQNLWLMLWTATFLDTPWLSSTSSITNTFLLFSLYWTTQVLRSVLSFYVTGTVCYRLVLLPSSEVLWQGQQQQHLQQEKPPPQVESREAFQERPVDDGAPSSAPGTLSVKQVQDILWRRALTVGLGSVCVGAITIGPISTLWGVLEFFRSCATLRESRALGAGDGRQLVPMEPGAAPHALSHRHSVSSAPSSSVGAAHVHALGSALRRAQAHLHNGVASSANRYAWARVALRGARFSGASKEAWAAIDQRGVSGVIQHDLAETALRCWSWVFGALAALITLALMPHVGGSMSPEDELQILLASFCLGAANGALLMEPLRAAVAAIFISFAEDPESLAKWPIVQHRFSRQAEMALFQAQGETPRHL